MTKPKHTPGPWTVIEQRPGFTVETREVSPVAEILASLFDTEGYESARADAHLIAAAPELLEALERSVSYFESADRKEPEFVKTFRAAIAKARGES